MNTQVIEWAPFRLKPDVDESALLAASERLQTEFLVRQRGFVRRELIRQGDRDYVDMVWWESMEAAQRAMSCATESPACGTYFSVMATNNENAGDGVVHFTSVRSYSNGS